MPNALRETYGVYIRFRNRRLTAARGLSWDEAQSFASRLRAQRFHQPELVFVIDEQTGQSVELATVAPPPPNGDLNADQLRERLTALEHAIRRARDVVAVLQHAVGQAESLIAQTEGRREAPRAG